LPADVQSWARLIPLLDEDAAAAECDVLDLLLVAHGRWWSLTCDSPTCCPPEGRQLPETPTAFAAAATVGGVVARASRASLEAELAAAGDHAKLAELIGQAENSAMQAKLEGHAKRWERSVKRAMFAAAREADAADAAALPDSDVARFGAALSV